MSMNSLLTADWHLTDNPLDEYRWDIFPTMIAVCCEHQINRIFILGDFVDRKDKHSGWLLNRVVASLRLLKEETSADIVITMGNHDMPLKGTPYWDVLNTMGIHYVIEPELIAGVWCLPFAKDPLVEWRELALASGRAILMHQTIAGSLVDGDRVIENTPNPLPIFPRGVPVYSGDVHRPQTIQGITYIGIPHPTRFSEEWAGRCLIVKGNNFKEPQPLFLAHIKRAIIEIYAAEVLANSYLTPYKKGDQVRLRFHLPVHALTSFHALEAQARETAQRREVTVVSVEALVETRNQEEAKEERAQVIDSVLDVEQTVRLFGQTENLGADVIEQGLALLRGAYA